MADCISPDAVNNFASKDTNRIVGKIAEVLAYKSPWLDVLEGGTLPNVSDIVRSIVQERASVASSLVNPVFTADISLCGAGATPDQVGTTEYSYQLESLRGSGPRVCVKTARTAFTGAYLQAQMSMEKAILRIINADIRATLYRRSGVKFVCNDGYNFYTLLTGDSQQIDTNFQGIVPNAPCSFKTLYKLGTFLREEMLAEPFESEAGTYLKWIGSVDSIEVFRNELGVKDDLLALTKGRYQIGEKTIDGYSFQGPYRTFGFGIDSQPMRASSVSVAGGALVVNLVEPEIAVPTTKGVGARRNPTWVNAAYEVGFLIAADSFKRLVPEMYTGEGTFKFNPQLAMGELIWHYVLDNDCNRFGDFGQHIYQISRAHQPQRPQNVIPVIYQRCQADIGLNRCVSSVSGL